MFRTFVVASLAIAAIGLFEARPIADASPMPSSSGSSSMSMDRTPSPEEMARDAYNDGIGLRDRARRLEEQAAKQEKDREKNIAGAREAYTRALQQFQKAVTLDPRLHQGFNGMGFAYRKLGDFHAALQAYDQALKLSPTFAEAIEYRGEAYLALDMTEDAKRAYLALFARDRKQADTLLKAMQAWVTARRAQPGQVHADTIEAIDVWIKERAKLSTMTMAMARTATHSMWN